MELKYLISTTARELLLGDSEAIAIPVSLNFKPPQAVA
jgi:hypothetical protein